MRALHLPYGPTLFFGNVLRANLRLFLVLLEDLLVNLFAVTRYVFGRTDAESDLLTTHLQDDDLDIVADDNALMHFPG